MQIHAILASGASDGLDARGWVIIASVLAVLIIGLILGIKQL